MEVLGKGYKIPFRRAPILSREPIPFPAYCPNSIRSKALAQEVESLLRKGAIELAPLPSPGYYSRLFVTMKASESWRPVIDLSQLNLQVFKTPFKMETIQSTLLSVRRGDWMVSLDLKDAYLQIPVHPESRKFLRFMVFGKVYQFKVLCFGLSTAPQVFTRVMAPVSRILHSLGIRLRHYLDDWLIQASSWEQVILALRTVLRLCNHLGIVINWEKSQLVPTQRLYLGVLLDSYQFLGFSSLEMSRQAALNWRRVSVLRGAACKILAGVSGSSVLSNSADSGRPPEDAVVPVCSSPSLGLGRSRISGSVVPRDWSRSSLVDGPRAAQAGNLRRASVSPARLVVRRLRCRRAHLGDQVVSGRWSPEQRLSSINHRELLAMLYALQHFLPLVRNKSVAVFADNTTPLAYLKNQGGTMSALLNQTAQELLRLAELHSVTLVPQFIMGRHNVLADTLSRPNQIRP